MTKKAEKENIKNETVYKPLQYVIMPEVFQNAAGVPGIPLGYSSMIYGLSDSGKTEILLKVAKEAIAQDIKPYLIITENKMDRTRLEDFGLINGENCVIEEQIKTLETVYNYISMRVQDIIKGRIKQNVIVLWDSWAGTYAEGTFSIDEETGEINQKFSVMKNAQVGGLYNPIVMERISKTREIICDYSLGLLTLNQAYTAPAIPPATIPSTVPNGGNKIWFPLGLSLSIREGQRYETTKDKKKYRVGLVAKLKVEKNHINGIYSEGEILLAGNEMLENTEKNVKEVKEKFKNGG